MDNKVTALQIEIVRKFVKVKTYLDMNIRESVNNAKLAEIAELSPFHFLRIFKRLFGITPHQYMIKRRLEIAELLLISTDMPITEIVLDLGMESMSYFSRLFRRRNGISPNKYRSMMSFRCKNNNV
ncbi:MAG: helix-turn-helix domain-containing protein [Candidatus Xenobiia bacterium LiM19]